MSRDVTRITDTGVITVQYKRYALSAAEKKQLAAMPDDAYLQGKKERYDALRKSNGTNILTGSERIKQQAARYLGSHKQ